MEDGKARPFSPAEVKRQRDRAELRAYLAAEYPPLVHALITDLARIADPELLRDWKAGLPLEPIKPSRYRKPRRRE